MKINVAVISRPGAGKSSLLACIYNSAVSGFSMKLPVKEDFNPIDKAYKALIEKGSLKKDEFTVPLKSIQDNSDRTESIILLEGEGSELSFCFRDDKNAAQIFIAVIDTPLFMDKNFRHLSGINEAQEIFINTLKDTQDNKLLLIVPVKSEAYTRPDSTKLLAEIKSAMENTLETMRSKYRGHSAVAVIPVHTVGGAVFSGFVKENDRITSKAFKRVKDVNFKPKNAEQILSFIANFLLHDANITKQDFTAIKKLASYAAFNNPNFEILYGHKLIEPEPEKKPEKLIKRLGKYLIAAAVVIAIIGGWYFMNSQTTKKIAQNIEESKLKADEMISLAKTAEHAAKQKTEEITQRLKKLTAELADANSYIEYYKGLVDDLEAELVQKQDENTRLSKELTNVRIELNKLKEEKKKSSWW